MAGHAAARHPLATGMVLPGYVIAQYSPQNVTGASNQLPVDQGANNQPE
jgi:hypothetical protein